MTELNPYAIPSANLDVEVPSSAPHNPHTLWKQVAGLAIASVIPLLGNVVAGSFVVLTGIFTFLDAWHCGIFKRPGSRSFLNLSPMAWGIAMNLLMIVTFPIYVFNRNRLKTKEGSSVYFVLVILFGGLLFMIMGFAVLLILLQATGLLT